MKDFSYIYKNKIYTISIFSLLFALLVSITTISIARHSLFATDKTFDTEIENTVNLSTIEKPNYNIPKISPDTNLEILPSDYDHIINTLDISLTQHQKMSLLKYGETECKSNIKSIKEGYLELIEKEIPILIPEQYLKEYIDQQLNSQISQLYNVPIQLQEIQCNVSPTFNNSYQRYIWEEMKKTEEREEPIQNRVNQNEQFEIFNFLPDLSSELINESMYKMRILNALSNDIDTKPLKNFLNNLIIYSKDKDDINAKGRISQELGKLISNISTTNNENIYWKISVIEGISYLYPVPLSKEYPVDEDNFSLDYDIEPIPQSRNSVRVPILMYHQIKQPPRGTSAFTTGLYVSPEGFEKQLAYLVKKNYKALTSKEFYNLLSEGRNPTQKSVMITFDDATAGQYINAFPLLKKYGLIGIFNVPSNKTAINYNQLREMSNAGMVIESHSATHIDLVKENDTNRLYSEIVGSRYTLRNNIGQEVITMCYPGCVADSKVYSYVSQAGYLLGTSCGKSIDHYFKNRLSLSRVHVFDDMDDFKNILSGKQ